VGEGLLVVVKDGVLEAVDVLVGVMVPDTEGVLEGRTTSVTAVNASSKELALS
jgi:hypothetical protein